MGKVPQSFRNWTSCILSAVSMMVLLLQCGGYYGGEEVVLPVTTTFVVGDVAFELPYSLHKYGVDQIEDDPAMYISLPSDGTTQLEVTYTGTEANPVELYSDNTSVFTLADSPVRLEPDVKTTVTLTGIVGQPHQSAQLVAQVVDPVNGAQDLVGSDGNVARIHVETYRPMGDEVHFVIMQPVDYDPLTHTLYSPPYNLRDNVNVLLGQAVVGVSAFSYGLEATSTDWDINGNNALDYYVDYTGAARPLDDEIERFVYLYPAGRDCWYDTKSAVFIPYAGIRRHYELMSSVTAGDMFLYLYMPSGLAPDMWLRVGPRPGQQGSAETVQVSSVSTSGVSLWSGLTYDHPEGTHTVALATHSAAGISISSCTFCPSGSASAVVIAHEYLHNTKVGPLSDVWAPDNLMYYTSYNATGKNVLRYRPVDVYPTETETEGQWNKVTRQR